MNVIALVIGSLLLVGEEDAVKKEMAQLEGEWAMMSGEANGQALPAELVKTGKRVAKGGETTITMGGQLYFKARYSIDPAKKPKTIDYVMTEGPTKGMTHLGIYELQGETVKFCFAAPGRERPTEFAANAGSAQTLSVWKRIAEALDGDWSVVQFERAGRKPPEELLKTLKVVIKQNTLRMSDDKRGEGATFKLDRTRKPHEIDLVFKEGPNEDIERTAAGIYELDGDTLKLAWRKDGGPRPTEFASIPGERTSELLILKREKSQ